MRALSLHHLAVTDVSPETLVEFAAELECSHICLITHLPGDAAPGVPRVRDEDVEPLRRRMTDANIAALGITSFLFAPDTDVASFEPGLARGARLGAVCANSRISDTNEQRIADNFGVFAELCRRYDLKPCIEFTGYQKPDALPQALRIIHQTGHGALTLDPLHIARTGTPWAMLKDIDPTLIGYVQLCDGPLKATEEDYVKREPFLDRLPPGDGEYPLEKLLAATPPHYPISLEVPCIRLREQGLGPRALAREIVQRTRAHLASLGFG
jgi:sugar phosphate isomerase/epimerase